MPELELTPDYTITLSDNYKTLVSEFENGAEQRRAKRSQSIKSWQLEYHNRLANDLNVVQMLFRNKKGAYGSFTWLNPVDGQTYTVRFKEDSFSAELISYQLYNFRFTLVQVL